MTPAPFPAVAGCLADRKAALLVIDVQVDFVAPHGFCAGLGADVSAIPAATAAINRSLDAARAAGVEVCFIRLETTPETDSPAMLRLMARQGREGGASLCRAGTEGADYWGIAPLSGEHEVVKSRYDAFLETGLDAWLRQRGIGTVAVCGVSTDCCVDSTARAAFLRDYDVLVIADACAAGTTSGHDAALAALARYAATVTDSATFAAVLSQAAVEA